VPGAFMSLIGLDLFRRVLSNKNITNASYVLDQINMYFKKLVSDNSHYAIRDGMDLSLIIIDKVKMELDFAGAFNPLVIVRDNQILEFKADRMSIGLDNYIYDTTSFTNTTIPLSKNDVLYLFTDGYADQFGGAQGKKFKKRRLRHLFLNIHKYDMDKQSDYLDESFESWKAKLDQIDDVLVIGVKI
jgi:serine phosphatase RsbU (regulator of sigma subunit)